MRLLALAMLLVAASQADWRERYRAGERLMEKNRLDDARTELIAALREAESEGLEASKVVPILDALGRLEYYAGQTRRAKEYFARTVRIAQGGGTRDEVTALVNAADALRELGELSQAETYLLRALQIMPGRASILHNHGQVLIQAKRYQQAEVELKSALGAAEASRPDLIPMILSDLASIYESRGKTGQAADTLDRAIAAATPGKGRARMLTNRGIYCWKLGRKPEAETALRHALQEMEAAVGPFHPDVGYILDQYSQVLAMTGRPSSAAELAARARAIKSSFAAQTNTGRHTVDWRDLK
jgi:tetratricopeptide (TPR) repeat protein